ncbi:SpoIIE family protein phosphatase [Cellulomonas sp. NS3]|uniref:SpoIIE family protein phosphatase n=1 Tax=Cellulomonas sp. NS3 TaxID=2973977 RepID=UPI002161C9DF|nr:SpoIIE family protein phosphatase [Cellulomonas sp. NS3]
MPGSRSGLDPSEPIAPPAAEPSEPTSPAARARSDDPVPHAPAGPDLASALGRDGVESAQIGTYAWDLATGELALDEQLLTVFGFDPDEFDGTIGAVGQRLHPHDRPRVARAFELAVEGQGYLELEFRVLVPHADARWVLARGRLVQDHDGRPSRAVGAAFDATARQQGEARTARLLEAMPTAFFSVDAEWRFTYVNSEGEQLLRRPREELLGGTLWDLFPETRGTAFETGYLRAAHTGETVGFEAHHPAPLDAIFEVRAWPGPDGLAVYLQDVTERHRAQRATEQTARLERLKAQVTDRLTETLDVDQSVSRLAPLLVPTLADWCIVTVVDHADDPGTPPVMRDVGFAHRDARQLPLVSRYAGRRLESIRDDSYVERSLRTAQLVEVRSGATEAVRAVLAPGEARDLITRLAPGSGAVVPLRGRGRTLALVTLFNGRERGPMTRQELRTAQDLAGRAGLALDNARLYRQQRHLAEELQRSLLAEPAGPEHVQIVARYVPAAEAAEVGGDWYDAFPQRSGDTVVVIGDVLGHDSAAAATMGQLRAALRGIAVATGAGPAELLGVVDQTMHTLRTPTMATAFVARLEHSCEQAERGEATVRWSNAGHPSPVLIGPDGSVEDVVGVRPDLLLGVDPDATRSEATLTLQPGATLVLFTDGLVERRDEGISEGLARLRSTLEELAGRDLHSLCDEVVARMLPSRPKDDVVVLALRLDPVEARSPEAAR